MDNMCQYLSNQTRKAADFYLKDFDALNHDQLSASYGGVSRTAYDITEELVVVNERLATRFTGGDPGEWPFEGFVTAPAEAQNKDAMRARFESSVAGLCAAIEGIGDNRLSEKCEGFKGESTYLEMASLGANHIAYHDGQLNMMQAIAGDNEVHWM